MTNEKFEEMLKLENKNACPHFNIKKCYTVPTCEQCVFYSSIRRQDEID